MVGYIIHTPPDLSDVSTARAAELGPVDVVASGSYSVLATSAGFSRVSEHDVTAAFADTAASLLRAREELVEVLRVEEGEEIYQEEHSKLCDVIVGIDEGLLLRSLMVAAA
jgi:hypothetical protein